MPPIEELYVLLEELPDGTEHVSVLDGQAVASSRQAFDASREFIQTVADEEKHRFRLVRFGARTELEVVEPRAMPAIPTELCWFCEASIELPIDRFGGVHGDRDIACHQCGAELRTTETEDDAENLTVGLAPVRCGHGIDHDEHCARCAS